MLRWLTAGESHGPSLTAILEGLPAHVQVTSADIADALARRRLGYGRGARMKFEQDEVRITGGVRHGETHGRPVSIEVGNTEWPKWEQVMAADPVDPVELEALARNAALTRPRPGHADLVGMQKYDFDEARPILERASARETAARVALGRVASAFLEQATGARMVSHVVELGGVRAPAGSVPDRRRRRPARRRPGPLPGPGRLEADGRADRPGAQGRRHPRRCRRGRGARPAARARLARALGPTARRAAGRRADGHPGDQGRRGRRRLRARRHARLAGPRRDRQRGRRHPSYVGTVGRHRGRHVHRRGAARPGRHEADRHRARAPCARSTWPPARRPSPTTSAPTSARCRRRASSPRRWWRWCSPTPCSRSSAATRSRETRRNVQSYLDTLRFR